ncbi:MAG: hypothetical protein ACTSPN_02045, partial [Promethearchaeota archaeon]
KLKDVTEQFDEVFKKVNTLSHNFIIEINKETSTDFNSLFQVYHSKIKELEDLLPKLTKQIREFGFF